MNEYIENIINKYLQHNIGFYVNNKCIKSGKLILFSVKDFHLHFILKNGRTGKRIYELPYCFSIVEHEKQIELNYNFSTIANNNEELMHKLVCLTRHKNSKLYNNKLIIRPETI